MTRDFEIVGDDLRGPVHWSREETPLTDALVAGKTVFVPEPRAKIAPTYLRALRRHGMKLHARSREVNGVKGTVMWGSA